MRKVNLNIEDIIDKIKDLKGQNIDLEIARGRRKLLKYTATIENIYPSIFTVRSIDNNKNAYSYSYADVLCGAVNFKESKQKQIKKAWNIKPFIY